MERAFIYTDTEESPAAGQPSTGPQSSTEQQLAKVYTPLQMHFLSRLQRLGDIRKEAHDADELTVKLVGRGIYSIYRECIDAGVGDEARGILGI